MKDFFSSSMTVDEIKLEFRRLAKIHHPDLGGDLEEMKRLNAEFEDALKGIWRKEGYSEESCENKYQAASESMAKAHELAAIASTLSVEVCGVWVWVSGDTRTHKDALKAAGCRWSKDKGAWYWKPDWCRKSSHRVWSFDEIRSSFGSERAGAGNAGTSGGFNPAIA